MIDELDFIMFDINCINGINSYQEVKEDLNKVMDKLAEHMGISKEDLEHMIGKEVNS